jgi:methylisocitrate lyase
MDGKEVVEVGEWLSKLSAALRERKNLFVTARTDARAVLGLDVAIERGRMARDLGVDAVFVEAPQSVGELETIARELTGVHLVANMVEKGKTPLLTSRELKDMGYSIVLSPLSGLLAASQAIEKAYRTLRTEGSLRDHLHTLTGFSEFTEIVAE